MKTLDSRQKESKYTYIYRDLWPKQWYINHLFHASCVGDMAAVVTQFLKKTYILLSVVGCYGSGCGC